MASKSISNGRKQWKKRAKTIVKRHYVMFVILCLVAMFYGTEFNYVVTHAESTYQFLAGIPQKAENSSMLEYAKWSCNI